MNINIFKTFNEFKEKYFEYLDEVAMPNFYHENEFYGSVEDESEAIILFSYQKNLNLFSFIDDPYIYIDYLVKYFKEQKIKIHNLNAPLNESLAFISSYQEHFNKLKQLSNESDIFECLSLTECDCKGRLENPTTDDFELIQKGLYYYLHKTTKEEIEFDFLEKLTSFLINEKTFYVYKVDDKIVSFAYLELNELTNVAIIKYNYTYLDFINSNYHKEMISSLVNECLNAKIKEKVSICINKQENNTLFIELGFAYVINNYEVI